MTDDYTHKEGIVYKNQFYIIFCSKYRRKVLLNGVDERLKEIIFQIAKEKDIEVKTLKIMPNNVHIFIEFDPRLTLHKIIKEFKRVSAGILREEFPYLKSKLPSLWTKNYFSCSVGVVSEETIKKYIENQSKD